MKSSYVLFGYEKDNINNCKYLQINNGYKFVDDVKDATQFDINEISEKNKTIKTIRDLVKFFNTELELKNWKFHHVKYEKAT